MYQHPRVSFKFHHLLIMEAWKAVLHDTQMGLLQYIIGHETTHESSLFTLWKRTAAALEYIGRIDIPMQDEFVDDTSLV